MIQNIYRILNIIYLHIIINFKSRIVYRLDFIIGIIIKAIESFFSYLLLVFLLDKVTAIASFSRPEMILLFGVSELSFAIWHCFFINSVAVGEYVYLGSFDRFLLRPVSTILQILLDGFDEDGWGALIIAIIVLGIASSLDAGPHSFFGWVLLLGYALCGALIYFSISLILSSLSFLAKTDTILGLIVLDLRIFARYPINIYPNWIKVVLSTIIPLAVCGYWPTLYYINGNHIATLIIVLTTLIFVGISIWFFYKIMRFAYESTGT